jgi:hypothetical protein
LHSQNIRHRPLVIQETKKQNLEFGEMRQTVTWIKLIAALMAVFGTAASVFAQASLSSQQVAASAPQVRRMTAEEAVKLALENPGRPH